MKTTTTKTLKNLLILLKDYISKTSDSELNKKPNPEKWSKKEIVGHLIDSGIHNLQRFIEVQFESKPYKIRHYNQDELVKANDYENAKMEEIMKFLESINNRIISVMNQQTAATLDYKVEIYEGEVFDLRYLMNDYVAHFEHHTNQIIKVPE